MEKDESKWQKIDLFRLRLGKSLSTKTKIEILLKEIEFRKSKIYSDFGVRVPSIYIVTDISLQPYEYAIDVSEIERSRFCIKQNSVMAMELKEINEKLEGEKTKEPIYKIPALWIPKENAEKAKKSGYKVVSWEKIIGTHLSEVIKKNLTSVITIEYVSELLDEIVKTNYALGQILTLKAEYKIYLIIKKILVSLLEEDVSIKNIISIFEKIAEINAVQEINIANDDQFSAVLEEIRISIADQIISPCLQNGKIKAVVVSQEILTYLNEIQFYSDEFIINFGKCIRKIKSENDFSILTCSSCIRTKVYQIIHVILLYESIHVIGDREFLHVNEKLDYSVTVVGVIGEDVIPESERKGER